jgi:hypothetical protein
VTRSRACDELSGSAIDRSNFRDSLAKAFREWLPDFRNRVPQNSVASLHVQHSPNPDGSGYNHTNHADPRYVFVGPGIPGFTVTSGPKVFEFS